ncbi:radical SAM protein [Dehalogenimonas sp. 4OHTPN]|uniref:Radical SAM protein n=1 Tax=Dehalogenimonas sp. 4OHTPN TaxID=3166643 RepID=A0AAU8GBJ6_9CHLR
MRILLVIPSRSYGTIPGYTKFPDEMLSIGGMLESRGHQVKLVDCNLDKKRPVDFLDYNPQLVGFCVATGPNITDALTQSSDFKNLIPGVKIAWGFRHASAYPAEVLKESCADYAVIGPGELTIAELADHLEKNSTDFSSIKGLAFKNSDGMITINEPRPFMADLDSLPDPAWHLIDVNRYSDVTLNTSRGCPFKCTICSDPTFYGGNMCDLSAERIVAQMEMLHEEYGIQHIYFSGERFVINRERLHQFCRLVIHKKWKITWNAPVSGALDEETVRLMKKAGCTSVLFEIETGSQKMLSFINKGTVSEMESSFWLLVKHHIIPTLFMMYGYPTESIEDFNESLAFMKRLDSPPYLYMKFVPYPGTVLFDYCLEHGLLKTPRTLQEWANFPIQCANEINLSQVPQQKMDEAMSDFRRSYATRRVRFMLRHNPAFFLDAVKRPREFFRSVWDLGKYYIDIILDPTNGSQSWLSKLVRKNRSSGGSDNPRLQPKQVTRGGEIS